MPYIVRDCPNCHIKRVQMNLRGQNFFSNSKADISVACQNCARMLIFSGSFQSTLNVNSTDSLDTGLNQISNAPVMYDADAPIISNAIPPRVGDLFHEAAICRRLGKSEAAGEMFRKTIDVATKLMFQSDTQLKGRNPADALRPRIKALGDMKTLDEDIVELADVAALDGNDAVHDLDPYTPEEAEALEDLTSDLLDRLYVRPAKLKAVRDKQTAAGQRKA